MPADESHDRMMRWIFAAREGDHSALADLLEHYRPYLVVVARRALPKSLQSRLEPEEIVQEAYIKAQKAIENFKGTVEPEFSTWVTQIVRNAVRDTVRHHTRDKRDLDRERPMNKNGEAESAMLSWIQPAANTPTPSVFAMQGEVALRLAHVMATLPEDQRMAIQLRFLEGRKIADIAVEMDRSPDAIAGLLRRGIKHLRDDML